MLASVALCIDWNNDNFEIEAAAGLRKNERIENLRPKLVGWGAQSAS
jgi:hypothetical protein